MIEAFLSGVNVALTLVAFLVGAILVCVLAGAVILGATLIVEAVWHKFPDK